MKKTLFLLVLSSLLMTSCLKDGFNDFNALGHDLSFNGTINPTLGVPIGEGSANVYDMLNMVQLSTAELEVSDAGIITITYDTTSHFQINMNNKGARKNKNGSKEVVYVSHNEISGNVAIDLFDNITLLDTSNIEVDSLIVFLQAHLKATAEDSAHTMQAMNNYHVRIYYDQVILNVVGQDNSVTNVLSMYTTPGDSLAIDNILAGEDIILFNNSDISGAINKRPKELRYSARMNIAFEAAFFATSGMTENQFVADSIGIDLVDVDAHLKARFPISAYIDNLQFETDIDFSPSFRLDELTIDSSMIFLNCKNGIPLNLDVRAQLLDNNDNVMCELLDPAQTTVAGADVQLDPVTNLYVSTGQKETLVRIPVTEEVFNAILNTAKIRLKAGISTSDTGNPLRNRVSIKQDDKIAFKVWAKLKPSYNLDFNFGGSDDNGEKGGVQ